MILKADLYNKDTKIVDSETIKELLGSCDLFIQNSELDKYTLQNYFWEALQKGLIEKGYPIEYHDFNQDVSQFYARARNRHRWYGVSFPIYTQRDGQQVTFRIRDRK